MRHPSLESVVKWIDHAHLPDGFPKDVSKKLTLLKNDLLADFNQDSPELTAAFRKLLEAKDCFVRAAKDIEDQTKKAYSDVTSNDSDPS